MKALTITFSVLLVIALAWLSLPYWPRSAFQDYVWLYLNDKKLQKLITTADKTSYDIIRWLPDRGHSAGIRTDTGFDWQEGPTFSKELVAAFEQFNTNYFMLVKQDGFWAFPGFSEAEIVDEKEINNAVQVRSLDYFYRFGGGLIFQECSDELITSIPTGKCDQLLFGNWVVEKSWFVRSVDGF
ncbi:hypothetical protein [Bowmanella yangjiangensis]|uniref:Uncharacterized protein n=1 Tax=Bowmanella yangjiangensis TaxID=2811230 RepID=A0ABS3CVR5_9ALTE|nr:hypothetical protein [Bowmanella yangjiangensis]MBN7821211.1 hypothetical protein [Bowmanella yangjiangensis]